MKRSASMNKLQVKCISDDDPIKPTCPHGPCLLFFHNDESDGYYACSCFRDKRDCSFRLPVKQLNDKQTKRQYELPTEMYRAKQQKLQDEIKQLCLTQDKKHPCIRFCHNCNSVILSEELKSHDNNHELQELAIDVDKKVLNLDPTEFLRPLQNDKAQAQYFFDTKSLTVFASCFAEIGITKVVCIGAPKLHGFLLKERERLQIKSYLLDFDQRFYYFYDETYFAWYNMCNNHFFDERQKTQFLQFLKTNSNDRILLFTDPPFGCRSEPIANTLRQLTKLYNNINKLPHQPLPIFWIFPYFSAPYIQNDMPELEMCDYKVNYVNHIVFSDNGEKGNRRLGSPVRIFTNVPLGLLKLPVEECYKYCVPCGKYTALENRHCKECGICPSKNGSTYRHCNLCGVCVKPYYIHCYNCRRCTQIEGHNCAEYKHKQRCWICLEVGHIERDCQRWSEASIKFISTFKKENGNKISCLLCGGLGHNERLCNMRKNYVQETTFLGKTEISFL